METLNTVRTEQLAGLFRDLGVRLDASAALNRERGFRFNAFRVLAPDEQRLSRIIRELLDPNGTHGQGSLFLEHFLKAIGRQDVELAKGVPPPRCEEFTTAKRRIDITLTPDGRLQIGIEHKPWARDQPGWVKDYAEYLKCRASEVAGGTFLLIFLTRKGRDPESDADKQTRNALERKKQFRALTYEEFKGWLEDCHRDCQADKVRQFLKDFIEYVPALNGSPMISDNERSIIVDYLRSEKRSLQLAYAIHRTWPDAARKILSEFLEALEERIRGGLGAGWVVRRERKPLEQYYTFAVYKTNWRTAGCECTHALAFAFERVDGEDFGIGVWKNGKSVEPIFDLNARMTEATGIQSETWDNWEWCFPARAEYRNWDDPATLERLVDKTEALSYVVDWFERIRKIAEPLIDAAYAMPTTTEHI